MSFDVTKQACKLAGVTLFSMIPAPQTQQSPRPEDVGSFEGTKPSAPAVRLAILLPTQHSSLFAVGMEDLGGDALDLPLSPVRADHWITCCFPALQSKGVDHSRKVAELLQQVLGSQKVQAGEFGVCGTEQKRRTLQESRQVAQTNNLQGPPLLSGRRT